MEAEEIIKLLGEGLSGADVRPGEPMGKHTSLRIGGPVDLLVSPRDLDAMREVMRVATKNQIPLLPLGGGTNLLVSDRGVEGVALTVDYMKEMSIVGGTGDAVFLRVGAGLPLQRLVGFARGKGLSGLEGLAGIPGRVGGAIAGNAGAYGREMGDILLSVALVGNDGVVRELKAREMAFGYRQAGVPEGAVILWAEVVLAKDSPDAVAERTEEFHKKKKASQPLSERSAGCVFKNPEGRPAGLLLDEAGCKGMRIGDIEVSRKHANFFINKGRGSADDFLALMEKAASRVRDAFGVSLEPEIKVVGRC